MYSMHDMIPFNVKIALPEHIALLLHPHVDVRFRGVWLLRNLNLDGKLCLRDDLLVYAALYI